jgi:hypothetical protein
MDNSCSVMDNRFEQFVDNMLDELDDEEEEVGGSSSESEDNTEINVNNNENSDSEQSAEEINNEKEDRIFMWKML